MSFIFARFTACKVPLSLLSARSTLRTNPQALNLGEFAIVALQNTNILTITLAGISGKNPVGIYVSVELVDFELVYPLGAPPETVFPTLRHSTTNA